MVKILPINGDDPIGDEDDGVVAGGELGIEVD